MEAPSRLSGERYTGETGKWRRPPGCQRASKVWKCDVLCKQFVAAQSSMCRSVARERRLVPLRIWTRRDSRPAARTAAWHVEWRDVLICNMLTRTHRARVRGAEQGVGMRGESWRWKALC